MKLRDKVAGVTGSARGMGWEMIQAFAGEGARVIICDLDQALVDKAVAALKLPEDKILGLEADVSVEQDVLRLFQLVTEKFHRLDIWVNNAGFAWPHEGPADLEVVDIPLEVWHKVLNNNLTGTFLCSRQALQLMRPQGFGSIINISSGLGKRGHQALRGPYCASKFGIEGLSQIMALENRSHGIRVNTLDPGFAVATERLVRDPYFKGKRLLRPDVIKACVVYLASDDSGDITGQALNARQWNIDHGIEVHYVDI